ALARLPLEQVDRVAADLRRDAVAEGVGQRVRDGAAIDVDRVDGRCAVERELHREDPAAAADVEAGPSGAEAGAVQVLPEQVAPLRGYEHARLDGEVRERERADRPSLVVAPAPDRRRSCAARLGPRRDPPTPDR